MLRRLGLVQRSAEQDTFERSRGMVIAAGEALKELEGLHSEGEISRDLLERLGRYFSGMRSENLERIAGLTLDHETVRHLQLSQASVRVLMAARAALNNALRRGLIGDDVWRDLTREMDALLIEGEEEGWERVWHEEVVDIGDAGVPETEGDEAEEIGNE